MNRPEDEDKFRDLLNQEYSWPALYTFKFIVPTAKEAEVKNLFAVTAKITAKPSSGGKYTSITANLVVNSADEIIGVYQKAAPIEGIISL